MIIPYAGLLLFQVFIPEGGLLLMPGAYSSGRDLSLMPCDFFLYQVMFPYSGSLFLGSPFIYLFLDISCLFIILRFDRLIHFNLQFRHTQFRQIG